jgi:hypothetical protein
MRRLVCTFLIFLSLFQWSWAGLHTISDGLAAQAHAAMATYDLNTAGHGTDDESESALDCSDPLLCCQIHSVGLLTGAIATAALAMGFNIPDHRLILPTDRSSSEIERPKWAAAV